MKLIGFRNFSINREFNFCQDLKTPSSKSPKNCSRFKENLVLKDTTRTLMCIQTFSCQFNAYDVNETADMVSFLSLQA